MEDTKGAIGIVFTRKRVQIVESPAISSVDAISRMDATSWAASGRTRAESGGSRVAVGHALASASQERDWASQRRSQAVSRA